MTELPHNPGDQNPSLAQQLNGNTQAPPEIIDSDTLFQGAKIILITHSGETYRLRITSRNRLILQK